MYKHILKNTFHKKSHRISSHHGEALDYSFVLNSCPAALHDSMALQHGKLPRTQEPSITPRDPKDPVRTSKAASKLRHQML